MATLEQIAAALAKADAAGNVEDARALANAYRQMQAQQVSAPAPADQPTGPDPYFADLPVPGTFATRAPTPEYQPSMVPWLDPVNSFANAFVEGIPIAGPALSNLGNSVDAQIASWIEGRPVSAEERAGINQAERGRFQLESGVGSVAGTVAPLMLAPQALIGGAGNILTRAGTGVASGMGITYADALARGDDTQTATNKALMGGAIGGVFPFAAKGAGILWDGVSNVLRGAVSGGADNAASAALKSVASDMFRNSEAAGIGVSSNAYGRFLNEMASDFSRLRANGALDPKAVGVMDELVKAGNEIAESGSIQLGDLHILRQIAQKAAQSTEGRDEMLNSLVIDKLDDFMGKLTPADIAGAADPTAAVGMLQDGISTWHVAKKASIIEEAMYKAQNQGSGYENGIRAQFRAILNNPRKRASFTPGELAQIEQVVNGSLPANALRLVGKFGFGNGSATNALGGFMGGMAGHEVGGMTGALAAAGIGTAARQGAEAMTVNAADSILQSIASGAPPPTTTQAIVRLLTQANDKPVNLPLSPVAAALMLQ